MKTAAITRPTILLLALATSPSPAQAQSVGTGSGGDGAASPAVQVTPFVAIDSRGSTPIGAVVTYPLTPRLAIETETAYRRAEGGLNALSSSASLVYMFPRVGGTIPYLASGGGIAQYGSPVVSREGSVLGTERRLAFEVNAGGGLMIPVDTTWGIRTDARWFKSFGRNGSEHWRVSNGISFDVRK